MLHVVSDAMMTTWLYKLKFAKGRNLQVDASGALPGLLPKARDHLFQSILYECGCSLSAMKYMALQSLREEGATGTLIAAPPTNEVPLKKCI